MHKFVEEVFENKKGTIMTYGQLLGQKSREEGKEEGILIGMEKGIEVGTKEIAKKMFSEGITISTIRKITGLSEETLKNLLKKGLYAPLCK